jgi:hypothetical protein
VTALRPAVASLLVPALFGLTTACTGDGSSAKPSAEQPPASPTGDGVVSEDVGNTAFVPGRFQYRFNSVTARASFDGNVATLVVRNGTGYELATPALYVLGIDDERYDGAAEGAAPIPDGSQVTLEFTFADAVKPQTIGLTVLRFGDDNVGAMAPVPAGG